MGREGSLFAWSLQNLRNVVKGIVSLLICLPVVGCLTGKYTLKDVVFEAVICFDCRNERKEEGGFLLNR